MHQVEMKPVFLNLLVLIVIVYREFTCIVLKPNDDIQTRLTKSKLFFHYRRVYTVRNFVLRRGVNSDVNVIFNFIYDDIHVLNHQMKILEVYRLWNYTCIVVLLLFFTI